MTKKQRRHPWAVRLKGIRDRHGLTQKEAAAKIGAATRTWIGWENGRTPSKAFQLLIDKTF